MSSGWFTVFLECMQSQRFVDASLFPVLMAPFRGSTLAELVSYGLAASILFCRALFAIFRSQNLMDAKW